LGIGKKEIVSAMSYNGQFSGPLVREVEVDFVADNSGLTLFHCHQRLRMDFGFMSLFDYV